MLNDEFCDLLEVRYCFNYVSSIYILSKINLVLYFNPYNFLLLTT